MSEPIPAPVADPRRSPSYPQRVHIRERGKWRAVLADCDQALARARETFLALPEGPQRAARERLLAQMAGARDQVAAAVRRMPMETGHLYEEDHHRLDEALKALARVAERWEAAG